MPTQLLPWGGVGIDRSANLTQANPQGMRDLRNVFLLDAVPQLRPGYAAAGLTASGLLVCHMTVYQADATSVAVTFDPATLEVEVWLGDLQGYNWTSLGTWGTLDAEAATPPRFTTAESFGIMLFAHDEPNVTTRLNTYRYDPADMTPFDVVNADLDGLGSNPVQFRWVATHYTYIFAGGYGTNSDPFRPEIIRQSRADNPTLFEPQDYLAIGVRGNPVTAGTSLNGSFFVGKSAQCYRIDGTSRAEWSVYMVDPLIGVVSPRALYDNQGTLYFWSPNGPRATTGQGIASAGLLLDLPNAQPASLPAPGALEGCHVIPFPDERHIGFAFPDPEAGVTLVYVLSLFRDDNPQWIYWTFPDAILTAALFSTGLDAFNIEPGTADNVVTTGSVGLSTAEASVTHDLLDVVGDETVEYWYKPSAGAWALHTSVPVNTSGPSMTTTLTGGALVAGAYDVAVRLKRGSRVAAGYEGSDPTTWPSASKASGTIVVIATPTGLTVGYTPGTKTLAIGWGGLTAGADTEIELLRQVPVPGTVGAAYTTDFFASAGTFVVTGPTVAWSGTSSPDSGDRLTAARGAGDGLRVRIRAKIGGITSAWTAAITVYIGLPEAPTISSWVLSKASVSLGTEVTGTWTNSASVAGASAGNALLRFAVMQNAPPNAGQTNYEQVVPVAIPAVTYTDIWNNITVGDNGCSVVGQEIYLTSLHLRHELTIAGNTHRTWPVLFTRPYPTSPFVCLV